MRKTEDHAILENENTVLKPIISVIVPIYNVESYLRRCVDSLLGQTLKDIEIILVDDGSTDKCGLICDEYAHLDQRVRTIHQVNAGLSEARNTGIDLAQAEYLMFVDSDDWVEPDFCRIPLTLAMEQQADLVMFQYRRSRYGREKKRNYDIPEGVKSQEEALRLLMSGVGFAAWNKLYHRTLFREHRYPSGKVYEDVALTPLLVHEAHRIFYSSAVLYNHVYRPGSITTENSEKDEQDWLDARKLFVRYLKEWGFEKEAGKAKCSSKLDFIGLERYHPELCEQYILQLRSLERCPQGFSKKKRILFYFLRFSPALFKRVYKAYISIRRK